MESPKAMLDTSCQLALVIGGDDPTQTVVVDTVARPFSHIATHASFREWAGAVERKRPLGHEQITRSG